MPKYIVSKTHDIYHTVNDHTHKAFCDYWGDWSDPPDPKAWDVEVMKPKKRACGSCRVVAHTTDWIDDQ